MGSAAGVKQKDTTGDRSRAEGALTTSRSYKGFGCRPHEGRRRVFIGAKRTSRDARLESVDAKFIGSRTDGDSTCSLHDGQIT